MKNIISIAAIPSRFQNLEAVLFSMSKQTIKPDKIYINLSSVYDRLDYTLSNFDVETVEKIAKPYKAKVVVTKDFGSMTKFLPTLEKHKKDANIIICDDDTTFDSEWLAGLVSCEYEYPAVFGYNGKCFLTAPPMANKMARKVAGPCDILSANNGMIINSNLINYDEFLEHYDKCESAKYAEDTFISLFLKYKNVFRIATSDSKLRLFRSVYSSINALHLEVNNKIDNHELTLQYFEGLNEQR